MKKILIFAAIIGITLVACDKKADFQVEKAVTVEAAGQWWVQYDHAKFGADPFGAGYTKLLTFNTSANNATEMWISDEGSFWDYKLKMNINLDKLNFTADGTSVSSSGIKVKIMNGGIYPKMVKLPSGTMADSIHFEIWFEDLEGETGIANDKLIVHGYRHTGFTEDNH
jgi:hypothetical protein